MPMLSSMFSSWPALACLLACSNSAKSAEAPEPATPEPLVVSISEVGIQVEAPRSLENAARFGVSVALDEDRLVVGCDGVRDGPPLPGRVLIYRRLRDGRWRWARTVVSPVSAPGDEFGGTLSLDDDLLLIGAPGTDQHRGAAWCLHLEPTGDLEASLRRVPIADAMPGDRFGETVIIRGRLLAVGAPRADVAGMLDRGRVVTARLTEQGPLPVGEPVPFDVRTGLRFGWALALDSVLHVGAPGADAPDPFGPRPVDRAGAVMSFDRKPPHLPIDVVHRNPPAILERFGTSLAIAERSRLLIGSPRASLGGERTGVVGLLTSGSMVEISGDPDDETGLGLPLAAGGPVFAAGMPGRRGRDGRPEPAVRLGLVRPDALTPRLDLILQDRSRTSISLALDLEGRMLAVGLPDPAYDDGPEVAGVVHLVRLEPLLRRAN